MSDGINTGCIGFLYRRVLIFIAEMDTRCPTIPLA
jgi:hypothetical protein